MKILRAEINNFRNIEHTVLSFHPKVNIIQGKNAQGKTNLLEAVWLLSGNKSFRTNSDDDFINFDKTSAYIGGVFENDGQSVKLSAAYSRENGVFTKKYVNDTKSYKTRRGLLGTAAMTVFSPDDLELIKAGPLGRRNYCDFLLSSLFPAYANTLNRYNRAIMQKGAVLKNENCSAKELEVWNMQLAALGASVIKSRTELIEKIMPYAQKSFFEMTEKSETIDIFYKNSAHLELEGKNENDICLDLYDALCENSDKEINAHSCLYGPHRDDLIIKINGRNSRLYASQGQQRSAVIALLVAKTELIREQTGKSPIVLLDDVMSELDMQRQKYIIERIENFQVFVTCCQNDILKFASDCQTFTVENGEIKGKES